MSKAIAVLLCTTLLWLVPGQAMDDPYVGYFVADLGGRHYRVNIERVNASTYDGILLMQTDDGRRIRFRPGPQ